MAGLTLSFSVFTLVGTLLLDALPLPQDIIRWAGLVVLVLLGLGMMIPRVEALLEKPFSRIPQRGVGADRDGFVLGLALGAVYVPCAGPVLAAITVAGRDRADRGAHRRPDRGLRGRHRDPPAGVRAGGPGDRRAAAGLPAPSARFPRGQRRGGDRLGGRADVQRHGRRPARRPELHLGPGQLPGEGRRGAPGRRPVARLPDGGPVRRLRARAVRRRTRVQRHPAVAEHPGRQAGALASLKGKVVLVDFWAYSCINCQRELPHAEAWATDYNADGLEVIGVHTPEYAFEHVPSNVAAGVRRLGLTYPVALDNDYGTWNAYDNDSWPATYLIDATGPIRHVSIGEGDYDGDESLIRRLLIAAHPGLALPRATDVPDTTPTTPRRRRRRTSAPSASRATAAAPRTRPASSPARHRPRELLRPVRRLDDRPAVDDRGPGRRDHAHLRRLDVYLDVGGTGTLTVSSGGKSKVIRSPARRTSTPSPPSSPRRTAL